MFPYWPGVGELSGFMLLMLVLALGIAFSFEFINGFHDTANAVATVIYTRSLKPHWAVLWSGLWNFIGVHVGGIAIAYSIVNLLPVDLLVNITSSAGLLMVLAILVAATVWNLGTWYLGLPASSSHTLIGAILGVGVANSLISGNGLNGINWTKALEVGLSLLLSPMIGFGLAAILLMIVKRIFPEGRLHKPVELDDRPPALVRALLIGTCTGVSFAHGSNDGQKGMGLIMLILIGLLPTAYALDPKLSNTSPAELNASIDRLDQVIRRDDLPPAAAALVIDTGMQAHVAALQNDLGQAATYAALDNARRWDVRSHILHLNRDLTRLLKTSSSELDPAQKRAFESARKQLARPVEYVPSWVQMGVALALGIGTTVGWKRIVVTVAEKIGQQHMTYSQGACAELVAMTTIGLADVSGLPVSTTHVLSSGIAGSMWANRSGIQLDTVKRIGLAWVLTMPAAMLLSGTLFLVGQGVLPGTKVPVAAELTIQPEQQPPAPPAEAKAPPRLRTS